MADRPVSRLPEALAVRLSASLSLVTVLLGMACVSSDRQSIEPEPREPVEAHVAVDRAVATTGDTITYTVELDYLDGYQVELPEPGAQIAGFRIQDLGSDPPRQTDDRIRERRWYRLRADFVGSYILPPIEILVRSPQGEESRLQTSEIFVEVESVLPEDGAATDIRDVKPLRRPQRRLPWLWIAAGSMVLLAGLVATLWWRRRRRAGPSLSVLAPHEWAFRELDRLRRTDFGNLEELRSYYFSISEVLRAYIEDRYGLNATDLTTEEILGRLDWLRRLDDQDAQRLGDFLTATDRVKYAAEVPEPSEIEATYEAALGFVESTRPTENESPEPAEDVAARTGEAPAGEPDHVQPGQAAPLAAGSPDEPRDTNQADQAGPDQRGQVAGGVG